MTDPSRRGREPGGPRGRDRWYVDTRPASPRARSRAATTPGVVRRIDSGSSPDRLLRSHLQSERAPVRSAGGPPRRAGGRVPVRPEPDRPAAGIATATPAQPVRRAGVGRRRGDAGVEANARLTGITAAVLFVLFAAEGLTILAVRPLLTLHVFIGMLLVPPILLKMGSTGWRFARYYLGSPAYRRKGPPPPLLRLLGPLVIVLTVVLFASGIALLLGPVQWRSLMFQLHRASFVAWLLVMAVHVLAHLLDTAKLAPRDFVRHTRRQVDGARLRQWVVASSLGVGLVLAVVVVPKVGPWLGPSLAGHL